MNKETLSRNKREGYYVGKDEGKHTRIQTFVWDKKPPVSTRLAHHKERMFGAGTLRHLGHTLKAENFK